MYAPRIDAIDVFKSLRNIKTNELLPEEGPLQFFYQHLQYPGITLFLRHKKRIKFFYIDHDDIILDIKDLVPEWTISKDKNLLRISLNYQVNDASIPINFVFDISNKEYRDLLTVMSKNKEVKLYYFPMLSGGLVFDSYKKFKIPPGIITALKKVK